MEVLIITDQIKHEGINDAFLQRLHTMLEQYGLTPIQVSHDDNYGALFEDPNNSIVLTLCDLGDVVGTLPYEQACKISSAPTIAFGGGTYPTTYRENGLGYIATDGTDPFNVFLTTQTFIELGIFCPSPPCSRAVPTVPSP